MILSLLLLYCLSLTYWDIDINFHVYQWLSSCMQNQNHPQALIMEYAVGRRHLGVRNKVFYIPLNLYASVHKTVIIYMYFFHSHLDTVQFQHPSQSDSNYHLPLWNMQIKWLYVMTSVLHADLKSKTWKASDSGHELSEWIVM